MQSLSSFFVFFALLPCLPLALLYIFLLLLVVFCCCCSCWDEGKRNELWGFFFFLWWRKDETFCISDSVFVVFGSCRCWGRLFVASGCQKGGIFLGFQTPLLGFLLLEFWRVELALCLSGKGGTFSKKIFRLYSSSFRGVIGCDIDGMGWVPAVGMFMWDFFGLCPHRGQVIVVRRKMHIYKSQYVAFLLGKG